MKKRPEGWTDHGSRNSVTKPASGRLGLGQRKRLGRIARKPAGSRHSGGTSLNPRKESV